jgi:hypothetical protein
MGHYQRSLVLNLRPFGASILHGAHSQFVLPAMVPAAGMGSVEGALNHAFHGHVENSFKKGQIANSSSPTAACVGKFSLNNLLRIC